jgi:putative ABC transport system ATP-binding protein
VLENIAIGFDDKARVKEVLDALQIGDLEKRMPYELSGGQKQRVAIARALIHRPVVILADEPTASLDHVAANKIIEILKETSKNYLVVMVIHDNSLIQSSDQVISIWDGQIN